MKVCPSEGKKNPVCELEISSLIEKSLDLLQVPLPSHLFPVFTNCYLHETRQSFLYLYCQVNVCGDHIHKCPPLPSPPLSPSFQHWKQLSNISNFKKNCTTFKMKMMQPLSSASLSYKSSITATIMPSGHHSNHG